MTKATTSSNEVQDHVFQIKLGPVTIRFDADAIRLRRLDLPGTPTIEIELGLKSGVLANVLGIRRRIATIRPQDVKGLVDATNELMQLHARRSRVVTPKSLVAEGFLVTVSDFDFLKTALPEGNKELGMSTIDLNKISERLKELLDQYVQSVSYLSPSVLDFITTLDSNEIKEHRLNKLFAVRVAEEEPDGDDEPEEESDDKNEDTVDFLQLFWDFDRKIWIARPGDIRDVVSKEVYEEIFISKLPPTTFDHIEEILTILQLPFGKLGELRKKAARVFAQDTWREDVAKLKGDFLRRIFHSEYLLSTSETITAQVSGTLHDIVTEFRRSLIQNHICQMVEAHEKAISDSLDLLADEFWSRDMRDEYDRLTGGPRHYFKGSTIYARFGKLFNEKCGSPKPGDPSLNICIKLRNLWRHRGDVADEALLKELGIKNGGKIVVFGQEVEVAIGGTISLSEEIAHNLTRLVEGHIVKLSRNLAEFINIHLPSKPQTPGDGLRGSRGA